MQVTQGTWNNPLLPGFKLPDFGITEKLGIGGTNPNQTQWNQPGNVTYQSPQSAPTNNPVYGPVVPPEKQVSAPTGGSGGGSGASAPVNNPSGPQYGWGQTFANMDDYNKYRDQATSAINTGYDQYFGQLDQMIGNLPSQRQGQEQIVQNSYNQGISDIEAQKNSSLGDLNTSKRKNSEQSVKTLNDIADNIRNLFQTGNVMLGTRGAGDSSAANQYSYAVTKLGSKQRGDVLSQTRSIENDIADREAKLNNVVTQEKARLKTDLDNQIIQVAQYFQDKQNELLQAKAQGQLAKGQSLAQLSTQLLNQAQSALMQADADFKNRQNTLMTWAANNATNINQLKTNLAAVGQYNVPGVQASPINGTPTFDAQGNMTTAFYGGAGSTKDELKNPFMQ